MIMAMMWVMTLVRVRVMLATSYRAPEALRPEIKTQIARPGASGRARLIRKDPPLPRSKELSIELSTEPS